MSKKLLFIAVIILSGNGILGYLIYKSNQKLLLSEYWVQHSTEVKFRLDKIFQTENSLRTAVKAFSITDNPIFLDAIKHEKNKIMTDVDHLLLLTNDNPMQHQRVKQLNKDINFYLIEYLKIDDENTEKNIGYFNYYLSASEATYTQKINDLIKLVENEEQKLLTDRKQQNARNVTIVNTLAVIVFVLIAAFTIALILVIHKIFLQFDEKQKREGELTIANKALHFENSQKKQRAGELVIANKELIYQNGEKGKRAAELIIADKELKYQTREKRARAAELAIADIELEFQNNEKEKRANELTIANVELVYQNSEKEKRATELNIANIELFYQNSEKEKRAHELNIANIELLYQNSEKEKRAEELLVANRELVYQNKEKEDRASELVLANKELLYQSKEKEKRADELSVANLELLYQNSEKEKRATERTVMVNDLMARNQDLEQYAYIISHNLRAPVANIIGAIDTLNDPHLATSDKAILNDGISKSVMKLDNVIKDLNAILEAKNTVHKYKEEVIFSELITDIKNSINKQLDTSNITLNCNFNAIDKMFTLKPYLYSIFYNLISNSVKYRRKNVVGKIEVVSRYLNGTLELLFTDNGMGIDMDKKGDEVFGLYKRFHGQIDGKGMGLYMVKTQVEALGGKISLTSSVNKGCIFNISFDNVANGVAA